MTSPRYDIAAIGNAIVDVLARAEDAFIVERNLVKGSMRLINDEEAAELYGSMGPGIEMSGGSAANTLAGMAALNAKCAFIGQVANDQLGNVFHHDLTAMGVDFDTAMREESEPATGRCLILVTPDGQRTMNTFLGAAQYLPAAALDKQVIQSAAVLYLEGYLWNAPESREAMEGAIEMAKAAGRKVAFTLSDTFVVMGHRDEFHALMDAGKIDILFANEHELFELAGAQDFDAAVAAISAKVPMLIATRGADGAIAVSEGQRHSVNAQPIDTVVDTTGAGDLFAAGVLAGLAQGRSIDDALLMGSICAAAVIAQVGPRVQGDLKKLVAAQLG